MEAATFAVDPNRLGPPWGRWDGIDPEEAAARGIDASVHAASDGMSGTVVIAPGDTRGTVLIPEKADGYCCGLDWGDGPNMACEACGQPVANRIDDCSLWQAVWLAPDAVRRLPVDNTPTTPLSWAELLAEGESTPPFETPSAQPTSGRSPPVPKIWIPDPGGFELIVIGYAFHRLNRSLVAQRTYTWLKPGGCRALCWSTSP
jgi:hypothetical protein